MERITNVRLPFDLRNSDPKKDYGIHGLDVWFILKGEKGAVQYAVSFPVYLPHLKNTKGLDEIFGFDVGHHSKQATYEGQTSKDCNLLDGGECYYDGSSLQADKWTEIIFSTRGKHPEEVLWPMLEQEYIEIFGELK